MKRRAVDGVRNLIQGDSLKEPAGEQRFDRLGKLGVLGLGVRAAFLAWQSVLRVRGLEHIRNKLQSRFIGPKSFQWLNCRRFEPHYQLAVLQENGFDARSRHERERASWTVVKTGIDFANDVGQYGRRGLEKRSAIAAIRRMTDPVGRTLGKEHRLIDVGGHASATEVLAECARAHQNDVVAFRGLLSSRAAPTGTAHVIGTLTRQLSCSVRNSSGSSLAPDIRPWYALAEGESKARVPPSLRDRPIALAPVGRIQISAIRPKFGVAPAGRVTPSS